MNSDFVSLSSIRNSDNGLSNEIQNNQSLVKDLKDCTIVDLNDHDIPGVPSLTACQQEGKRKGSKNSTKHQSSNKMEDFSTCPQAPCSVRLINEDEMILFDDVESFAWHLGCPMDRSVKLIAIVGNTGDGKSYTLNHAFCNGSSVFVTSPYQLTCTIGIWAAYVPKEGYLLIDTEGLLGASSNPNRQRRLLLKVFALADVVIYRTLSDRLHSDMFSFLADASDAFAEHFRPDLEALAARTGLPWTSGQLGPAVVVFQETQHTVPLDDPNGMGTDRQLSHTDCLGSAEPTKNIQSSQFLMERIRSLNRNVNAFSALVYVGLQTKVLPTNFKPLVSMVTKLIRDTSIRTPRKLVHIFHIIQALSSRFSSDLPNQTRTFVDEYFTCPSTCTSCGVRCCLSVNHVADNVRHMAVDCRNSSTSEPNHSVSASKQQSYSKDKFAVSNNASPCRYDPVLQNKLYYCKLCYAYGQRIMMVPKTGESNAGALSAVVKYLWAGYVLECPRHGTIYRSRGYWSGNLEPEMNPQVHWEVVHVWPGEKSILLGTHSVSQLLLDSLTVVSSQVTHLAGPPARRLGDFIADSVAPRYWQPNSTIKACSVCRVEFPDGAELSDSADAVSSNSKPKSYNQSPSHSNLNRSDQSKESDTKTFVDDVSKHHCRACGRGVCARCSTSFLPVPDQGYGSVSVRVCDQCYETRMNGKNVAINDLTMHAKGAHSKDFLSNDVILNSNNSQLNQNYPLTGRKMIELLSATADYISPMYTGPKELVKSLARPDYWQPDDECKSCFVCLEPFNSRRSIHHCRACGQGVCGSCSRHYQPVPTRGLDFPSRVCDTCFRSDLPNSPGNPQRTPPLTEALESSCEPGRTHLRVHPNSDRVDPTIAMTNKVNHYNHIKNLTDTKDVERKKKGHM